MKSAGPTSSRIRAIRFFQQSHNTVNYYYSSGGGGGEGIFALKQWIFSSLKHDTVPRVNNFNWFMQIPPPPPQKKKKKKKT